MRGFLHTCRLLAWAVGWYSCRSHRRGVGRIQATGSFNSLTDEYSVHQQPPLLAVSPLYIGRFSTRAVPHWLAGRSVSRRARAPTGPVRGRAARGASISPWSRRGVATAMASASCQQLFAYWLVSFMTLGMQYAYGALYVQLLDQLDSTRDFLAFVGSLSIGVMDGSALLSGVLVQRLGSRRACWLGASVATVGWVLSAAVSRPWQLLLTYSLLVGAGMSLALNAAIMLMNLWFTKRLSLAHACANTGGALSPFLMGLLAPSLFDAIGWRHTFLVFGAMEGLVLVVAGSLLTPPSMHASTPPAIPANVQRAVGLRELLCGRDAPRLHVLFVAGFFFGFGAWIAMIHLVPTSDRTGV